MVDGRTRSVHRWSAARLGSRRPDASPVLALGPFSTTGSKQYRPAGAAARSVQRTRRCRVWRPSPITEDRLPSTDSIGRDDPGDPGVADHQRGATRCASLAAVGNRGREPNRPDRSGPGQWLAARRLTSAGSGTAQLSPLQIARRDFARRLSPGAGAGGLAPDRRSPCSELGAGNGDPGRLITAAGSVGRVQTAARHHLWRRDSAGGVRLQRDPGRAG